MDQLHRFVFEGLGIRGELVQLGASWQAARDIHPYPPVVAGQLGQALVAVALLSGTIKFSGSLIMQLQGPGPLRTLVAQATDRRTVRGMASWEGEVGEGDMAAIYGQGRLVITADAPSGERYQGIVAAEGENLAAALERYFVQSEQLDTRLWLFADEHHAAGLFLQRLPGKQGEADDWGRVTTLANTVTAEELLTLDVQQLLHRLFHEETLRLYDPEPVAFRCGCSRERVAGMLRSLGQTAVDEIVEELGAVEVNCEFCNRQYRFDAVDVAGLFAQSPPLDDEGTH